MRRIARHGHPTLALREACMWSFLAPALLVAAVGARPCLAQRSNAYRPSLTGPSTDLTRNFGRVGGWLGSGGIGGGVYRSPSSSAVSADLSNPLRQRRDPRFYRRPGMGQSGMDLGYGVGAVQTAPLIYPGRAYDPLAASRVRPGRPIPVAGALARAYQENSVSQRQMVSHLANRSKLVTSDYLDWVPAGMGSMSSTPVMGQDLTVLTDPVVSNAEPQDTLPTPTQTLEELVANHVTTLRRSYMDRGWRSVKAGEYLDGLRMFSMAEKACIDDPQEQADARIAMVYTAIAAGQFRQAANSLEWLASDTSGGRRGHPAAFVRVFDEQGVTDIGRDLFTSPETPGEESKAYAESALQLASPTVQGTFPSAAALSAVIEWGRGRASNAISEAQKVSPQTPPRLLGLAEVLREADRLRASRVQMGSGSAPATSQ